MDDAKQYCPTWDSYISATIANYKLLSSGASNAGGAMYILDTDPRIRNCTISYNTAGAGGAIYHLYSAPQIDKCIFLYNESTDPGSIGGGAIGGAYHDFTTDAYTTITNSVFYGNDSGSWGGAISHNQVYPTITNCSISRNGASIAGGGPSVFGWFASQDAAAAGGASMRLAFEQAGLESDLFVSPVRGPRAEIESCR